MWCRAGRPLLRSHLAVLMTVLASVGCGPDFDLAQRRFACQPAGADSCGAGWRCGVDGFCSQGDAGIVLDVAVLDVAALDVVDATPPRPDAAVEICLEVGASR